MMNENYRGLAAAVIRQAVDDYRNAKKNEAKISKQKVELEKRIKENPENIQELSSKLQKLEKKQSFEYSNRKKAEAFFKGKWFEDLCGFIDLDPDYVRRKIKVLKGAI
jgi:predicted  nucleic acid-binding Zn-ribbon protein